MATGGEPICSEMVQMQENIQEQNDEILALKSIFENDADEKIQILSEASDDGEASNMLQLFVPMKKEDTALHVNVFLPFDGVKCSEVGIQKTSGAKLERSESGRRLLWSFEAHYLPPLCLHVTLGSTYPSCDPPSFVVSCSWLSPQQLSVLCKELDGLWLDSKTDDAPGMPILYTWFDWLQENTLSMLGLTDTVSVYSYSLDEEEDDCRVVIEDAQVEEVVSDMMRYNKQQEMAEFCRGEHECGICFDVLPGSKFYLLSECGHHVCQQCMSVQCKMLVQEGSVQALNCPSYQCKTSIPQPIIKAVLSPEEFSRYEKLSLQKCLAVMEDIVWCPRCQLAVVREPEEDLNLAHCIPCFFSFCTNCLDPWHQGEICKLEIEKIEERKRKLESQRNRAKEYEEEMKAIQRKLEEELQSSMYISSNATRCPKCNSPIMKTGGCNKVTCSQCGTFICWVCMRAIKGYDHFSDNSRCSTFTYDQYLDNADMNIPVVNPVRRPPPRQLRVKGPAIDQMLKMNPELKEETIKCTVCKQVSIRENKHNHIRCWNCQSSLCFQCRQRILGPVGKHYTGRATCNQHG